MYRCDPIQARLFAVEVVRRLRESGFEALWAGGCVRDELMGREPQDFDVATAATPNQIRDVFGWRRTLAIGASFGVITVLGPRAAGQIDVATFRRDGGYSDGRHPDSVAFSTAAEDALRRDFTVNGLFYDPLEQCVIDHVGGQADLERSLVRAIGDPRLRFAEDKLRLLRAIRFACTLSFEIDPGTWQAILASAPDIAQVSAERIAAELRRMLVHPSRARAMELLRSSGLLPYVIPAVAGIWPPAEEPMNEGQAIVWDQSLRILERLVEPPLSSALAVVLRHAYALPDGGERLVQRVGRELRLSNEDRDDTQFLLEREPIVRQASSISWPRLQRTLIDPRIGLLLDFADAVAQVVDGHVQEIAFCRDKLLLPRQDWNPPPLLTGDDLRELGVPSGPVYRQLLEQARDAQLVGLLRTREEATAWVRTRWLGMS